MCALVRLDAATDDERLAHRGHADALARKPETEALRLEPQRRLVERLVRELERAPVHRDEGPGAEIAECAERLLWVEMLGLHEPRRVVGADGEERGVDAPKARPDLRETGEPGRVARVVDRRVRALDDEPAPERPVRVEEPAAAPVL